MPDSKIIGKIKESEVYTTSRLDQPVKLRMNTNEDINPISIPEFFYQTVEKFGNVPALVSNVDERGDSQVVTYREYYDKVIHVAKAFIKIGLERRHSVAVLSCNCPEWFYSEMAAIQADAVIVGIYMTSSIEAIRYVLENSKANIIVVDDSKQMEKIRQIRRSLPLLKAAIQINAPFADFIETGNGYYKWSEIESMDVTGSENEFNTRLNNIGINECSVIIYTSGTEGMPKGVMLSHDNIVFNIKGNRNRFSQLQMGCERFVSYLPLNHIAAQTQDIFLSIELAATVYFADKNALKGSLIETIKHVKPTHMTGVPRVYEKIQEKIISSERDLSFIQKIIIKLARDATAQYHMDALQGNDAQSFQYKIASHIIGQNVKSNFGLDQIKTLIVGAAPTSRTVKEFFMGLDIKLLELYGLSEAAGMQCCSPSDAKNLNTVGKTFHGTEIKILKPNELGEGEICLRGRNTFMGYLENEEKTIETYSEDGWLKTGDLGYLDCEGNLFINGRIKEIVITSGGENIPFVHVEHLVKRELPILSNAFLVGDKRKYLVMLVTLKTNMDLETGEPLNSLQDQTIDYFRNFGLHYTILSEVLEAGPCPKVMQIIKEGIDRANTHALSNAQRVQKFSILPHDFSISTGELGVTLKVRRQEVYKIYSDVINSLYENK